MAAKQAQPRYSAFLSYNHSDIGFACQLQAWLETYRLPRALSQAAPIVDPRSGRLRPVFRDQDELRVAPDLSPALRAAIADSRAVVVICTPNAPQSAWVGRKLRSAESCLVPTHCSPSDDRKVKYKTYAIGVPTEELDDEDVKGQKENDGETDEFKKNPFHVDLDTLDATADPVWIKVKVVLRNENLEFQDVPRADPLRRIRGVALEKDDPHEDWFCQKPGTSIILNRNDRSVLTYYVRHRWTSHLGPASINLHIVARATKTGRETPIIIDPRIKNEG